jgi:SAP domain
VESLLKNIDTMKIDELKLRCKEFKLKVSGKKAELQVRLKDHYVSLATSTGQPVITVDYDIMDLAELKDVFKARNINKEGTREELIAELRKDDEDMKNLVYDAKGGYEALCSVLYEVERKNGELAGLIEAQNRKAAKVPKNIELKIQSLGLIPETFSAGGAASVTAAVLQKLAGNPYADPPRYGTVSGWRCLVACTFSNI